MSLTNRWYFFSTNYLNNCIFLYSAGVGRTGTYIACEMLRQSIQENAKLNVFKTVIQLREQRTNMVQTQVNENLILSQYVDYLVHIYT